MKTLVAENKWGEDANELSFGFARWISVAWKAQNCSSFAVPWHGSFWRENGKENQTGISRLSSCVWECSPPCHPHASWASAPVRGMQSRHRTFAGAGCRAGHVVLGTVVPRLHQSMHSDAQSAGNHQNQSGALSGWFKLIRLQVWRCRNEQGPLVRVIP